MQLRAVKPDDTKPSGLPIFYTKNWCIPKNHSGNQINHKFNLINQISFKMSHVGLIKNLLFLIDPVVPESQGLFVTDVMVEFTKTSF